jgi:hypothetical protein
LVALHRTAKLCRKRASRLVAVVAVTSTGQRFARHVAPMGDAGQAEVVGLGLASVEAHRCPRTARGWVLEVHSLTVEDCLPPHRPYG